MQASARKERKRYSQGMQKRRSCFCIHWKIKRYYITMTSQAFNDMVDNLINMAQHDPELLDKLQWLDRLSIKECVSFYQKVYELIGKKSADDRTKKWNKERKK